MTFSTPMAGAELPFAERSWHTCSSCRYHESKSVGGGGAWGACILFPWPGQHMNTVEGGKTCNRYSPRPWAIQPKDPDHGQ